VQSERTETESGRHILIVDDNPDLRSMFSLILERDGWIVESASDGAEAMRKLQGHLPNIVLLDLAMPHMDGWAVLARRAVEPTWMRVPVIAMSADHRHGLSAIELGANAFLPKPFTVDNLRETVEQYSARP
jgi:chemosensory pili system protein ChpA (sensor histidine kinase/response regulator)